MCGLLEVAGRRSFTWFCRMILRGLNADTASWI